MRVAGIGKRQYQRADIHAPDQGQDRLQRHVAVVRSLIIAPADVHANPFAWNVAQTIVDGGDHAFDKAQEIAERPVLKRDVMLERQIRAIELEQKTLVCNRFIFDLKRAADRSEVGVLGVVMLVLDRRYHDAGGGGGQERLHETAFAVAPALLKHRAEIGAFAYRLGGADIVDLADHLRRRKIADHFLAGVLLLERSLEYRIALDIGARP